MKNKIFRNLSIEKRQKILMHTLRNKTRGMLTETEEAALLSVASKKNQLKICVFNDINLFKKSLNIFGIDEFIYGENSIINFKQNALIDTGIAVIKSVSIEPNSLLIYIPETRRCNGNCVREKIICEHTESYKEDMLCCGLQRVEGV